MSEPLPPNGDPAPDGPEELEGLGEPEPGGWEDYPLDELKIRDERRTAQDIVRRVKSGRFVLDPDFQRGFVWDETKQSRLVESILMRIPLPVFYVAEDAEGRLVVVDGRQRLTTIQRFFDGELRLKLPKRVELDGKRFDDLDPLLQNRVEDCQLHFYIIERSIPERARLDIFERVNGGEVLTRQQMRNALYNGPATYFLREEAATGLFVRTTGHSLNTKTMRDREFVNRFCSFHLLPLSEYKDDMDDWLARGLVTLARLPEREREEVRACFRRGLDNNARVFGEHAFRKHRRPEQRRSVLNASLFDVMMAGLCRRDPGIVDARADRLRSAFYALMEDERFIRSVTYGPNSTAEVRTRFHVAAGMMREVFDAD